MSDHKLLRTDFFFFTFSCLEKYQSHYGHILMKLSGGLSLLLWEILEKKTKLKCEFNPSKKYLHAITEVLLIQNKPLNKNK